MRKHDLDHGTAGASARREHNRRRARREQRVRDEHPLVGGVLLALSDAPAHELAWERGARGEERVAAGLAKHLDPRAVLLHDRRIPASRANIDHLVIAPSGVWVVDAKRYKGKVGISRPLFGKPKLMIGGRCGAGAGARPDARGRLPGALSGDGGPRRRVLSRGRFRCVIYSSTL